MRIYLREATIDDGGLIVKWRNDPKILEHCFSKKSITEESNKEFFENNVATGKYKQYIVERIDEEFGVSSYPIAVVSLKDFDEENRRCELCIFTSNDKEWNTDSQAIAVRLVLEKAFCDFKMHKVYSYAFYRFMNEANLLKKSGFEVEAVLKKEAMNSNGQFEDVVRFAIFENGWNKDSENEQSNY